MAHIRYIISEIVRWIIPIAILGLGAIVLIGVIVHGKPAPPESESEQVNAALVETAPVQSQSEGMDIDVDGLVVPYREITLAAEVSGRVVKKTPACQAGNYVTKGTLLLEIDPRDYQFEVRRLEKQLEQAKANLEEIRVGHKNITELAKLAEDSLKLQENEVSRLRKLGQEGKGYVTESQLEQEQRNELTARNLLVGYQNQLRTLEAQKVGLESVRDLNEVQLEKARLDLERTNVESPIDGIVVTDSVETDAYINRGAAMVTLEDTAKVEVRCNLRMDDLFWILSQKPGGTTGDGGKLEIGDSGSYQLPRTPVTVQYTVAGRTYAWEGVLERYEGIGLDQDTRTVPCTVVVNDPRKFCQIVDGKRVDCQSSRGPSALVRGMFVKLLIHTRPQTPLLNVPELAMRPGNRVWRVRDGKLSVVPIQVISSMKDWAVIQPKIEGQLTTADKVVVSPLAMVEEGMAIREQEKK